jgi:hypothetical protein
MNTKLLTDKQRAKLPMFLCLAIIAIIIVAVGYAMGIGHSDTCSTMSGASYQHCEAALHLPNR